LNNTYCEAAIVLPEAAVMTALSLSILLVLAAPPIEARAAEFATTVQEIHQTIQSKSIVGPSPRRLVELSLRGLYKAHGEELPDDLAKRLKNEKATTAELRAVLRDGYHLLATCRELDVEAAVDEAIGFTLAALDPHASWKPTGPIYCEYDVRVGVGLELRLDAKTGMPVLITLLKDSPAYRAGIRAGDVITHITPLRDPAMKNDTPLETQATAGADLPQVRNWLLGTRDSKVLLDIQREGVKEPLRLEMTRGPVGIETVAGWRRKHDDSWDYRLDPEKKIGYLRVSQFNRWTPKEMEKALDELETQGIQGVVLDLRCCEGGLFIGMIDAAGQFLDKGDLVLKVKYGAWENEDRSCKEGKGRHGLKVVCLVNGETSSAAEMFVAALQDHHRAVIVGERTSGKGSGQVIEPLNHHDLYLTICAYLRPNGKKLDRMHLPNHDDDEWGVMPDTGNVVQLSEKEQTALKESWEQRRIIPRRDVPVKEPPAFKDRQLMRALAVLAQ
jgi:carboxyl-terminal processing protease